MPPTPNAPVIRCDVPGSFARAVFHERHPALLRQVLAALPYGPAQRAALRRLLAESTSGELTPPDPHWPDHARWLAWGAGMWGRPWGEAPFLWAESWFYRRLLDATGYFRPGAWQGVDPFAPFKSAELAGPAVDAELAALATLPEDGRADALLTSALWGNRADLSFRITAGTDDGPTTGGLLVDDRAVLWDALAAAAGGRVCVVADNAGPELLPDLLLIDHLLAHGSVGSAVLFVKPQPYFVSDATMADVLATLERLRAAPGPTGARLRRALADGTLEVRTHPFFCAPLPYHDLPADLRAEFAGAAMTILKGDLNYRRLVGDRHWPATTPFADTAAHFPSPVTALRTLKSEVAVGLPAPLAARLDRTDPTWRTGGHHAVIQSHPTT
ncbi:damage-control phosphatase ARMT1 family protein [Kitasatospora sp. NPDC088346]|uniref:damage-control phosphatase ARMT1 family protein n=1 Tax=Kitasatospora sp. NPDC088346 TaxID=3364073 RepID=UPI0037FAB38A